MNNFILVADDNEDIVEILSTYLKRDGFHPIIAYDGEDVLSKFNQYKPILILLDWMMPKKSGLQICTEIRQTSGTPIIMITARSEEKDMVTALEAGADDYIIKPFSPGAVMARVKALLRRANLKKEQKKEVVAYPNLEINIIDYIAVSYGKPLVLTKKEIEILWLLATNPNRVFTRENILDSVWGIDYFGDIRVVDTHMKRLRRKLGRNERISPDLHSGWEIDTIWGVGYKFKLIKKNATDL